MKKTNTRRNGKNLNAQFKKQKSEKEIRFSDMRKIEKNENSKKVGNNKVLKRIILQSSLLKSQNKEMTGEK